MKLAKIRSLIPAWQNALFAVAAAVLLLLAFPDFEFWVLAWFALVPLLWAIEREKESTARGFVLGWLFGTIFFFGTCWWLTFAPITYAGFPPVLAYFLLLLVCIAAGIFPAIFGAVMSFLLRRFGSVALLAAPFVWVFTEFARYWLTGNNWNAIGYSQAFNPVVMTMPEIGGILAVSFAVVLINSTIFIAVHLFTAEEISSSRRWMAAMAPGVIILIVLIWSFDLWVPRTKQSFSDLERPQVIALQPNVPMSGLTEERWRELRQRHIRLAESAIDKIEQNPQSAIRNPRLTVIFPESPMNFMYETDAETKAFIDSFAAKHNVNVLFNSAEPDAATGKFFNSAVMVGPEGREVAQYDKIYLLPFGEAVPFPLDRVLPGFVGNFAYGSEHDLFPLGDAKAGVMICFESHFGQLSREYVRNGADVLIEMTNDGYLGPTPVLRQHLANAVFRAVETNRPVLRVTNVGITAYINERGEVLDPATAYQEDTRIWSVARSDGSQTFYVKYGDWFAWLCTVVTLGLLVFASRSPKTTDIYAATSEKDF
jgi:apolipoprotein N-acyltransferase